MYHEIDINTFLEKAITIPIIDVRTPAEYSNGHFPGAYNVPLFDNQERKIVGTIFKKQGREQAVYTGLELVAPKLVHYVRKARKLTEDNQLLVYCWRGGMRSSGMAWLFDTAGLSTYVLKDGYKAYRQHVLKTFNIPFHFIVIGGMTGSGKSSILNEITQNDHQTIDLERLAHHKGSAFGSLGERTQNTNEQFENDLSNALSKLNPALPVWIEDESRNIGFNLIPDGIFKQIREAPLIYINMPKQDRIARLVNDYAGFDKDLLSNCIIKISKRLGGLHTKMALEALQNNDFSNTAALVLNYYDKTYQYSLSKRDKDSIKTIKIGNDQPSEMAFQVLEFAKLNKLI